MMVLSPIYITRTATLHHPTPAQPDPTQSNPTCPAPSNLTQPVRLPTYISNPTDPTRSTHLVLLLLTAEAHEAEALGHAAHRVHHHLIKWIAIVLRGTIVCVNMCVCECAMCVCVSIV
jgi:hypothetical protein